MPKYFEFYAVMINSNRQLNLHPQCVILHWGKLSIQPSASSPPFFLFLHHLRFYLLIFPKEHSALKITHDTAEPSWEKCGNILQIFTGATFMLFTQQDVADFFIIKKFFKAISILFSYSCCQNKKKSKELLINCCVTLKTKILLCFRLVSPAVSSHSTTTAGASCSCQSHSGSFAHLSSTLKPPFHPQVVNNKWILLFKILVTVAVHFTLEPAGTLQVVQQLEISPSPDLLQK